MNKNFAQKLINKTRDDYNKISAHFASTRKKGIWPDNLEALDAMDLKEGESILDVGSGSGRLFPYFKEKGLKYTGIDLSDELVEHAKTEYGDKYFSTGDATKLTFKDNIFDHVVTVAVIYHIPSKALRQKAIDEIYRVTKSGGTVYISVWYFWNKWPDVKLIIKEAIKIVFRKSDLDFGDFYRPWKSADGKKMTDRYCHAWTPWGLKRAIKKAGFTDLAVIKGYKKGTRNLNIVCKKS